jgi:hypothetical protein
MSLWMLWWNAIWMLRPAFSRLQTFLWFATAVAGLTVRTDMLGVTSIVRALNLKSRCYNPLDDFFHSSAVKLDLLTALWTKVVLRRFPQPLCINGRYVLVGDGIKIPKRGRKMPAVKLLHQQSDANTKPEFVMGHSIQAVSLLVQAASSFFAVPLAARIHEGLVWSNRDRRTLLDKILTLLGIAAVEQPLLRRRRLLCRAQDRRRPARAGRPSGHPGEIECRGLHTLPAAWPAQARPAQGLWQEDQAQLPAA